MVKKVPAPSKGRTQEVANELDDLCSFLGDDDLRAGQIFSIHHCVATLIWLYSLFVVTFSI